jgi:hypothetical protein
VLEVEVATTSTRHYFGCVWKGTVLDEQIVE